jgi:hypothetical protein
VLITGVMLTFSTPLCCALFPQNAAIALARVEPELHASLTKKFPGQSTFFYNKGL